MQIVQDISLHHIKVNLWLNIRNDWFPTLTSENVVLFKSPIISSWWASVNAASAIPQETSDKVLCRMGQQWDNWNIEVEQMSFVENHPSSNEDTKVTKAHGIKSGDVYV